MTYPRFAQLSGPAMIAILITATVFAKEGREFAGYYTIAATVDRGDKVDVTLKLQLYNYTGTDLRQAVVTIRSSRPGPGLFGSSQPLEIWRNNDDVVFTQTLTVPREEYQLWTPRNPPGIFVIYTDDTQKKLQRGVQVTQRPSIPF